MRQAFADELNRLERHLIDDLVGAADTLATVAAAVRSPSESRLASIVDAARKLRSRASSAHAELIVVTAQQTPVAGDLRLVLAIIELAHNVTLIANQFDLIAEQLSDLNGPTIDRGGGGERLTRMSADAGVQLRKATTAFRTRDVASARELDRDDDALDKLNRELCDAVVHLELTEDERELGLHHVLIARSLERIGDNAVDIAEQAEFVVTAERREYSDASQPRKRPEPAEHVA